MRRTHLALLSLLSLFAACSGGGGNAAGTTNKDLVLAIDTSAGTTTELRARFEGVFFETTDGQMTGNLLRGSQLVSLTHPLGEASGLRLAPPPLATFVALHLLFLGDLEARADNGVTEAVQAPTQVRVPFRTPLLLGPDRGWLALSHDGPLRLERRGSGTLGWDPRLIAGLDQHFLHLARAQVVAVAPEALAADVLLTSLGGVAARVDFAEATQLGRISSDDDLTPRQFVDGLRVGTRLLVSGLLTEERTITAVAAFDLGPNDDDDDDDEGRKSEVRGTIVELLPADRSFQLRVQEVRKGGDDLSTQRPLLLTVRAGDAKIKWVPRHARHRGHLGFDALRVGMCVEVEWFGPVVDGTVKAHKIDIRGDGPPPPLHHELEGRVTAVQADAREIVLAPASKDVFELGDERLVSLTVRVPENAVVIDTRGDAPRTVAFEALAVQQDVFVRGWRDGERLVATIVLILGNP